MPTRVTIMLEDDLARKIRDLQASQIKRTKKNVSFSQVVNQVLKKKLE